MKSRKLFQLPSSLPPPNFPNPFSPKPPSFLATNLIKSYFDAGLPSHARHLFDEMPHHDVVAWSAMITGYTSCHRPSDAWATFHAMLSSSRPNDFTFSAVLKACKAMNSLPRGAAAHALALAHGCLGSVYVANALMDMYAACCGDMGRARAVFEEIGARNAVTWTTLIAGYTHLGDGYGGLDAFREMLLVITLLDWIGLDC